MEPRLKIKIANIFEAADDMAGSMVDNNFQAPDANGQFPVWPGDWIDPVNHFPQNEQAYKEQQAGIGEHLDRNVQNNGFSMTPNPAADRALMVQEPEVVGTPDLAETPGGAGASGTTLPAGAKPQLSFAASKIRKQASGFNNTQARTDFTMGVVASINTGTLVNSRVVVETPSTKVAGTVLAVGDAEFAVVWDDRTASVERKSDYELVFAE
jgi:hypothetical protein